VGHTLQRSTHAFLRARAHLNLNRVRKRVITFVTGGTGHDTAIAPAAVRHSTLALRHDRGVLGDVAGAARSGAR